MKNALLFASLIAAPVLAQSLDPSEARDGEFGGKVLITSDVDSFWKAWAEPAPPQISTTSKITLGHPVYAMVIFHGCRAGNDGNCNVGAHFEIKSPNGVPYDEHSSGPAWNGPPAPDHNLLASLASLGFRLEPKDSLGVYEIKVTLTDKVAGKSVSMVEHVTAEAQPNTSKLTN